MSGLRQVWHGILTLFRRDSLDNELNAELCSHLELAIADNLKAGSSPQEARRQALIRFGGAEQTKEAVHEQRTLPFLETFLQDLRYAADFAASTAQVVLISASTAHRFWPGKNIIGSHLRLSGEGEWRTIVGIVPDVRAYDLQRSIPDWINGTIYLPFNEKATLEGEHVPSDMSVVVQTGLEESQLQDTLRLAILSLAGEIPVSEVKPMQKIVSGAAATSASTTVLFVALAGLALVLGAVGIYGVLSFLVAMRTREIGIRMSLGALPRDVLWLVLREGAQFCLAGITLGLTSAFVVTRLLSSELYGVSPGDPVTFLAGAVLMTLVTLLACYVPTRRAMRVDPMAALRYEQN